MAAPAVVEGLEILEDRPPGRLPGREVGAVHELGLEAAEEGLHGRVVPAVPLAAHGLPDAVPGEDRPVVLARVLHPAVGVLDQPRRRLPSLQGHPQGVARQLGPQVVGHAPADDLARGQVLDRGEVEPAFPGRDVAEVGQPDRVRPLGGEVPVEQVRRDRVVVPAVGRARHAAPPARDGETVPTHEPRHPLATDPDALRPRLGVHARAAVGAPAGLEDRPDPLAHPSVGRVAAGRSPPQPGVEAAGRDADQPAQHSHREGRALGGDEAVPHEATASLAKKAAARLRISFSCSSRLASRRSRASSAASAFCRARASAVPAASRSLRQPRSCLACPPSSSATACKPLPLSSSRLTASALNSAVNRRRFLFSIVPSRAGEPPPYEGVHPDGAGSTRPPRIPPLAQATIDRVVELTPTEPPHEATHWTASAMAAAVGISPSSVLRVWRAHKLRPHRVRAFKLSKDPAFAAKLRDIVGLYLDPPAHAVVLSVDEKPQIQALDRTRPGLPVEEGRPATVTHDYGRNGTTTLFAALNVLDGTVVGRCMQRHRHQEFIRFLNAVEAAVPAGKLVHAVLNNYGTHKHPKVLRWLERHPRWNFHFTPTSASWLNAVEGFFAKLTKRRLKRGVFGSLVELQAAIKRFLAETNRDPKPFVWTAKPEHILEKVRRGNQALDAIY